MVNLTIAEHPTYNHTIKICCMTNVYIEITVDHFVCWEDIWWDTAKARKDQNDDGGVFWSNRCGQSMRCVGVRPIEGAQGTLLQCPFDVFHALLGSKTWAQSQRLHHVDGDFTPPPHGRFHETTILSKFG